MMRAPCHALAALAALCLSGCATVGLPQGSETPVDPQTLLAGYRATGEAQVRFTRVHRLGGIACDVRLYANGQPIADVAAGRAVVFGVAAGELTLRATFAERGICPSQVSTLTVRASAGQLVSVVYDISHNGQHILQAL